MQPLHDLDPRIRDGSAMKFREPAFVDARPLADFAERTISGVQQSVGPIKEAFVLHASHNMQSFADSATHLSARDCRPRPGKILPVQLASKGTLVPQTAVELFRQNVNALVEHHKEADSSRTYENIAKAIGISTRSLTNARTGAHAATLDTVQAVAEFFKLAPWQLFMEDLPADILLNPRIARVVRNVVRAAVQEEYTEMASASRR